ncbi:MAG: electron transport complex subunit RsxC [Desulfobacteraceae bacterium]|nr:MAG: electron transport complex subunit RsxC [Desulfobacteraceae bacterium]
MAFKNQEFEGKGTFHRGVHPPERKHFSADAPIEALPAPSEVLIPLQQHIGAPCKSLVKPKQEVAYGDVIGDSDAMISARLHAPISGIVQKIAVTTLPNGRHMEAIHIKAAGIQFTGDQMRREFLGGRWSKEVVGYDPDDVTRAINDAGIVGLGGAAFPTHIKISPFLKKKLDTLIVNGCECEPYLTADDRLMRDIPEIVISGALLSRLALGADNIIIGIEENKPEAIAAIRKAAGGTTIKVAVLKTKYPQGSEKHLIKAVVNRTVPLGGLPSDVKVAVSNVTTITAVARAVIRGLPLTHRVVCVTGAGIHQPKHILAPIGISYRALIEFCGGLTPDAARVLSGGPMMGFAFTDLDMPLTKGTGGVTVLTRDDIKKATETACLRCGKCVDACPMNLVPSRLAVAARHRDMPLAEKYKIRACMECGSCAYVCPAGIPLVQLIRVGKAMIMASSARK